MALQIVSYAPEHFIGIDGLWREAFPDDPPWNRADVAIPAKMGIQPDLLLVALEDQTVIGSIMAGYDGHRGWLYSVAVRKTYRRKGVGAALVQAAEQRLHVLGCTKVNLQVRATNTAVAAFYESLGYSVEQRVSLGKRLQAPTGWPR